jgi:hypothetical protein
VPGGLGLPPISLPGRKPKDKAGSKPEESVHSTVVSVDGTLRKLGEKDLLLQTGKKVVLRFRLLPKTKFQNKAGEAVRDSLLHAGDQLSLQASPDDVETALTVVLIRAGTSNERYTAELPVEDGVVRAPRTEDMSKPRTVTTKESTAPTDAPPATDGDEPKLRRRADGTESEAEAPTAGKDPGSDPGPAPAAGLGDPRRNTDEAIIADARETAGTFSATLPNYLVEQVTSRYFAQGFPARWQPIDVVTADLAYVNGKEDYRNFRIDDRPVDLPIERTGTWSTGEFGTTLEDVMGFATNAQFKRRGEEKMLGRTAVVFDYSVAQANSHWTMVSPDGRQYKPAYTGAVWVDKDTRRVLRIEQVATAFPRDFTINRAEAKLQYAYARIDQKSYLLPASSENIGCMSGSGACTRNAIEFRNYKKFTTESNITFGK